MSSFPDAPPDITRAWAPFWDCPALLRAINMHHPMLSQGRVLFASHGQRAHFL